VNFIRKNWLCWDVGLGLFYQKCSVGLKYVKNMDPTPVGAHVLMATTNKKGCQLFAEKKCPLAASVAPNVKSWLCA